MKDQVIHLLIGIMVEMTASLHHLLLRDTKKIEVMTDPVIHLLRDIMIPEEVMILETGAAITGQMHHLHPVITISPVITAVVQSLQGAALHLLPVAVHAAGDNIT